MTLLDLVCSLVAGGVGQQEDLVEVLAEEPREIADAVAQLLDGGFATASVGSGHLTATEMGHQRAADYSGPSAWMVRQLNVRHRRGVSITVAGRTYQPETLNRAVWSCGSVYVLPVALAAMIDAKGTQ